MRATAGVFAAVLVAIASPWSFATAAPANLIDLDRQLVAALNAAHVPGAQVVLIERDKVTFAKSYGYADIGKKRPVTNDTVFRAGSISKSFTSIAVMTAVESRGLSLEGRLADLAPEVKFTNPWEQTNPVRLVNLLEHTAGWPDISLHILNLDKKDWSVAQGVREASPGFVSRWRPGYFPVYNNAGPAVAAVALEKATGESFEEYMNAHVLRPMDMTTADFDLPPSLATRIANSYQSDGAAVPYQHIILKPAGSLNTNALELSQLVRLMLGRGTVDGHRVLASASVARIERGESNLGARYGFTQAYGLGNAPFPNTGIIFRGHNGQIDAFTAVEGYNTRCNCGYVLMANGGEGVDFDTPIANLIQHYLTRGMTMAPAPAVTVADAELAKYAGLYRVITPPNVLTQPLLDVAGLTRVSAAHGRLIVSGNAFVPLSPHLFHRFDKEVTGLAFAEDRGQVYKISAFNAAQKMPIWLVAAVWVVGVAVVVGVIVCFFISLTWLVLLALRRNEMRARLGLRVLALPVTSLVALSATFGLVYSQVLNSSTSSVVLLASPTPYALAILVCSVLFPIFALWGLWSALRARDIYIFSRTAAAAFSVALLAVSAYLASLGWVGVRVWTM